MKYFIFWGFLFLQTILNTLPAFGQTSNFLERANPVVSTTDNLYIIKENNLYTSNNKGITWDASNISTNSNSEGVGSFSTHNRSSKMALFLINKDGIPSLYNSLDKGRIWTEQSLDKINFTFNPKMFVNLLIEPQSTNNYYLFVYDLSQQSLNIETSLLISRDSGSSWTLVNTKKSLNDPAFIFGSDAVENFLNPIYAVNNSQQNSVYIASLYKSTDKGNSFQKINADGLPANSLIFWLSIDPTNPSILYAPVIIADKNTAIYKSINSGQSWFLFKSEEVFNNKGILGVQINPINNQIIYVYTEDKIYISLDGGDVFSPLPFKIINEINFLALDQSSPNYTYFIQNNTKQLMRTSDNGLNWQKITPRFEAEWLFQTQGDGILPDSPIKPFQAKSNQKINLEAKFKNSGNVIWRNHGSLKVGFYVYKDLIYSGPPEYNDPANLDLFGKSWFADNSWGESADGKTAKSRASLLKESLVLPNETGTFNFVFKIPNNAKISPDKNDPKTKYDDRFIREDLTLAWGSNWMDNFTNGDPINRAHIWIPVKIIK